eukprot:TRINITY_DN7795_c0_g1_i1.p1 TRINITY_DN7795_c0_g1~~TRINITY_DN7795_c0_g1_i1.p1  ORF type:complete len:215 (-),score=69.44 TRINITY_DN7795_c0_g1_i1:94-678(-)
MCIRDSFNDCGIINFVKECLSADDFAYENSKKRTTRHGYFGNAIKIALAIRTKQEEVRDLIGDIEAWEQFYKGNVEQLVQNENKELGSQSKPDKEQEPEDREDFNFDSNKESQSIEEFFQRHKGGFEEKQGSDAFGAKDWGFQTLTGDKASDLNSWTGFGNVEPKSDVKTGDEQGQSADWGWPDSNNKGDQQQN